MLLVQLHKPVHPPTSLAMAFYKHLYKLVQGLVQARTGLVRVRLKHDPCASSYAGSYKLYEASHAQACARALVCTTSSM